jgi:hypothetical protein
VDDASPNRRGAPDEPVRRATDSGDLLFHGIGALCAAAVRLTSLAVPLGAVVVHADEPWGNGRPNDFGQILADLTAVALSTGKVDGRAAATADTVQAVLYGTTMIATAAGILTEYFDLDIETARKRLIRLARAHGVTPTAQAAAIVRAQETSPADPGATAALHPPRDLTPPPHIG